MTLEVSARVTPATVAIVGRPNVGKSALFNRLIGKRMAIVDDEPGVTRDRLYALAEWRGRTFSVVDTAGIDTDAAESDDMARETRAQAEIAANDADVIVFVVDAESGLMALDDDVVHIMRKTRRPVILVANKAESERVQRLESLAAHHVSRATGLERDLGVARSDLAKVVDAITNALGAPA